MSEQDQDGVFHRIQLRSITPQPTEKVLGYLEGMANVGEPDNIPPRSAVDPDEYRKAEFMYNGNGQHTPAQLFSPAPRSKASDTLIDPGAGLFSPQQTIVKTNGHVELDNEDADSNVQEGIRSELGEPIHEPGPNDPPGAHYPSSGPSFGNFGPLPTEDQQGVSSNPYARGSWNNGTGLTEGGQSAYPAGLTSGQAEGGGTPRQTSVNIDVQPPSRATQSKSSERDLTTSPKPQSKFGSDQRPWSPVSQRSRVTKGTAASISPSDSPSNSHRVETVQILFLLLAARSPPPGSVMSAGAGAGHQNRPFSPYRHAPTQEDLLNAAARGRSLIIPQEPEKEPSSRPPVSRQSRALSQMEGGRAPSSVGSRQSRSSRLQQERDVTPTPSRPHSPEGLDAEEARIVNEALARTPRTSIYAAPLDPDEPGHFHDMELCVLLHQENDPNQHEFVKKALRKAVRQRIKKLGMKYDHESINKYRKSYHDHDPSVHLRQGYDSERIESLGPKIEGLKSPDRSFNGNSRFAYEPDETTHTPMTQTVNIQTGTMADSMYQAPETEMLLDDDGNVRDFDEMTETPRHHTTDGETRSAPRSAYEMPENGRDDSPGQQCLEEELYKLRQKPHGSQLSHKSWEVAQHDDRDDFEENGHIPASNPPTIPDTNGDAYHEDEHPKPEMAVQPQGPWNTVDYSTDAQQLPPWQKIHARLLNWAIIWPMISGRRKAYKRYVRARLTDSPQGVVDRLFVPPNMADAISNAVFNGRHGDACGMLKDLWAPFGLEGMPRLIVVLAKHRSDPNHWVVHRFSLPEGSLTTYDCYPERTLPDGRVTLGWWFAIRVAWPNTMYPSPDHLMQKMVRLHRPLQLPIDNAVAAAGIWRNVLMGVDLERLRDLINTEVKNLRQRKQLGKLSINAPRPAWEDMS
ncbi:hypothetical protein CPB84DRAFT_1836052 [Gymnopilus junonius]|uniref:Uncharacterized protein n=1 Tax=Gymnopilus junonius TaxID=109634 RepID=A0A9P5NQG4_GYMJU|nr:hypothetical protein CPB84DRAFT_1836052 [Gymnopilus junonius]